jgi:hypothetical protein
VTEEAPAPSRIAASHSTRRQRRLPRQLTGGDATDSDDEVTLGDDLYEVDVTDNFWRSRMETRLENDDNDQQEEEEAHDNDELPPATVVAATVPPRTVPPRPYQFDLGELLKNCTQFRFTELSDKQAAAMPLPPRVFDQPSGLRQHVKDWITNPFQAFRHSGFTDGAMVARWTKNSNK